MSQKHSARSVYVYVTLGLSVLFVFLVKVAAHSISEQCQGSSAVGPLSDCESARELGFWVVVFFALFSIAGLVSFLFWIAHVVRALGGPGRHIFPPAREFHNGTAVDCGNLASGRRL
jgi:hypothetical protein